MAIVRGTAVADQVKKRIGNIVFRQTKDGTIAAQRPASMTNPRTLAQMSQRIRLASLVTFYRASRYWMKKGWELKDRKESDYNAFVKANLATNPVALTKSEASNGACVVYPYKISKGSLAPIQWVESGTRMLSNLYIGDGGNIVVGNYISGTASIGELSQLILVNNVTPREGDQLSILSYMQSVDADGTPYVVVSQYEIILDITDGRLLSDFWPTSGNGIVLEVAGDAANLQLGFNKDAASGFAIVLSRTEGGLTRVSSQSLIVPDSTNYSFYTSAQHVSDAAASYGQNTEVFLDSNSIETPAVDPITSPAIVGVTIGSAYSPVGQPTAYPQNGQQIAVRLNIEPTLATAADALIIKRWGSGGASDTVYMSLANTDVSVSGKSLVVTASATLTAGFSSITVKLAGGATITAVFPYDGGIE